jgi:hypothetical protein
VEVPVAQLLGVGRGRGALVTDVLGVVPHALGEGVIDDGLRGRGGLGSLLLLFVEPLLLVGALDLLFGSGRLEGVLIVGDIESFEWIRHGYDISKNLN